MVVHKTRQPLVVVVAAVAVVVDMVVVGTAVVDAVVEVVVGGKERTELAHALGPALGSMDWKGMHFGL